MVNSVPYLSSLVSVSCIDIIVQVKILILSSVRSNKHMIAPRVVSVVRTERFSTNSFIWTPAAITVRSYSFNPLWTMITTVFQEKSNTYHNSESIISRFFPDLVHFGAVSLIRSAPQKKKKVQHFARFWRHFRSVMWSRSILVPFYLGVSLSLFFWYLQLAIAFLIIKMTILLGLAGYQIIITSLVLCASLSTGIISNALSLYANLRVPARVYDVEGAAIFSKNSTFVFFDILVQYSDKFMQSIVKFLIVLLHSLLLCFCTVLLCEVNAIQCHA